LLLAERLDKRTHAEVLTDDDAVEPYDDVLAR
jgi:hypothetical protein